MKRNAPTKDGRLDQAILLAFDVAAGGDGEVAVNGDNPQELRSVRDTVSRAGFRFRKDPSSRTEARTPQQSAPDTAEESPGLEIVDRRCRLRSACRAVERGRLAVSRPGRPCQTAVRRSGERQCNDADPDGARGRSGRLIATQVTRNALFSKAMSRSETWLYKPEIISARAPAVFTM